MIAFVLSGGGSRGAMQVGALRALIERGIRPQMMVGTSVGAINSAFLAVDPSVARVDKLQNLWRNTRRSDIYPGNRFQVMWRIATGKGSLYPNDTFYRFLKHHISPEIETFDDFSHIPCYITTTNLETGAMRVLGERGSDRVIDALMATTALPPLHPPYALDDGEYVDGGAVALLPIEVALQRGAREVYALHIVDGPTPPVGRRTLLSVGSKAIGALVQQQWKHSVELCQNKRVRLHHIQLIPTVPAPLWDYSHTDAHCQAGYDQTVAYLSQVPAQTPWHARAWQRAGAMLTNAFPSGMTGS